MAEHLWLAEVCGRPGLFQSLPSSAGGAGLAGLWLMLLHHQLLMRLAVTNRSLAWQGERVLSQGRGEWEDGLWGPHPAEKVGCVSH